MSSDVSSGPNEAQIAFWNSSGESSWVPSQVRIDKMLRPFGLAALDAGALASGHRVLDVGCGCGDTTLEAASRVGSSGHVTGLDVSAPMLELARTRASGLDNVAFVEADAQTTDIASLGVDRIVSRFGVMFFADASDAFVNLRSALAPDGSISFVCWQTMHRNPWMGFGMRAVGGLLDFPPPDPGGPGPFSLGEKDMLLDLMHTAGFASVELTGLDGEVDIVGGATIEQAVQQSIDMSPIEAFVGDDEDLMATVRSTMTDAFAAEWSNGAILLPSSVWVVTASNACQG